MIATASCMAILTIPMTCLLRFLGSEASTKINRGMLVLGVKKLILVLCYNAENDHRKRSHSKTLSRVERFENDAF